MQNLEIVTCNLPGSQFTITTPPLQDSRAEEGRYPEDQNQNDLRLLNQWARPQTGETRARIGEILRVASGCARHQGFPARQPAFLRYGGVARARLSPQRKKIRP